MDADGDGAGSPITEKFAYEAIDAEIGAVGDLDMSQWNAWADLDDLGNITMRRLYQKAVDAVFARIDDLGNPAWYLTDNLGSVRDLIDNSANLLDHLDYTPFGQIASETNPTTGDRYKYTSREWDTETQLQYNRARYYDPTTRRWISQDPLGFDAGDGNLYRYVTNQPTVYTDSSGLAIWTNPWLQYLPRFGGGIARYPAPGHGDVKLPGHQQVLQIRWSLADARKYTHFLQLVSISTVILTCDGGKLQFHYTGRFITDVVPTSSRIRLRIGNLNVSVPGFWDEAAGPNFDKALGKKAVLVYSYVRRYQGLRRGLPAGIAVGSRRLQPLDKDWGNVSKHAAAKRFYKEILKGGAYNETEYRYLYWNFNRGAKCFQKGTTKAMIQKVVSSLKDFGPRKTKAFASFAKVFQKDLNLVVRGLEGGGPYTGALHAFLGPASPARPGGFYYQIFPFKP